MSEHDVIAPQTAPETPPQSQRRGPVLIELEDGASPHPSPSDAPPVPDLEGPLPEGRAMQIAARLAAKPASKVSKFFWRSAAALFTFMLSVAAWRALEALIASNPIIGWIGVGLTALFVLACCVMILRELRGWARLGRLDRVQKEVRSVSDLATARKAVARVEALYGQNPEQAWGLARLRERQGEILDGETLLDLAEAELMGPLDQAARREIEAAARQVATVTALVPLALADVFAALTSNLRMIRRLGEIYGGRAGTFGAWRLARSVLTHLVATGAVAVGDDFIETVAGGGVLSKLSRRFGEGVVNGALTARVGVAAMEVCRPMPFKALPKPRVTQVVSRALAGLFGRPKQPEA